MTELEREIILRALACQIILTEEANRKVEAYVISTEENELSKYTGNELAIHVEIMELRKKELKEYKDVFASFKDPIVDTETMAYIRGFRYGSHPDFTTEGASTTEGRPYLWKLYTDWLLATKCEDATMEDFWRGFVEGVFSLSVNKEQK